MLKEIKSKCSKIDELKLLCNWYTHTLLYLSKSQDILRTNINSNWQTDNMINNYLIPGPQKRQFTRKWFIMQSIFWNWKWPISGWIILHHTLLALSGSFFRGPWGSQQNLLHKKPDTQFLWSFFYIWVGVENAWFLH